MAVYELALAFLDEGVECLAVVVLIGDVLLTVVGIGLGDGVLQAETVEVFMGHSQTLNATVEATGLV